MGSVGLKYIGPREDRRGVGSVGFKSFRLRENGDRMGSVGLESIRLSLDRRRVESVVLESITLRLERRKVDSVWLKTITTNHTFISNSSHCSTTILSKHITSALTAVKDHAIKYSETAFSNSNVDYFLSIKNSSEVIEKLRLRNFQGSQVSSFDFSTLYTSLPHDLIKEKVLSLV